MAATLREDTRAPFVERLSGLSGPAYRLAMRLLGSQQDAEDVVQQAYLDVIGQVRSGSPPVRERAWFLRAVANIARERMRSEAARRRREAAVDLDRGSTPGPDSDLVSALGGALAMLEEKYRLPLSLCYEEGLTQRETAVVLKMPKRTVSKYVHAGLERLRKALASAGYPAAVATVLGGLKQTAPAVPASLASRMEALVVKGALAQATPGSAAPSAAASGAKGGMAMKILAGVVLAGAVAVGAALVGGRGPGPLGTTMPATERKDPPHDQKYSMRMLVWNFWTARCGMLDGPAGQAESTDLIKGHDVDDAGNVYWTECDEPVVRSYRAVTDRVVTVAGSIRGLADGPLDRARFGGWSYNSTNLICVSGDGKHLFVRDVGGKGLWRYVDLEAGTVHTLGQWHHYKGGYYVIARDKSGEIYAFITSGQPPPDCKGYKKLKVAPSADMNGRWISFDRFALDVEKMRFYWHCRGPTMMTDLKTGAVSCLTAPGRKARRKNTSGPLATTVYLCPTGMSISPAGRYVYVGQGDGSSCFRLDLEKKYAHVFGGLDGGGFGWRETGETGDKKRSCHMTGSTGWPAATVFIPDGRGYWATCWGLYGLTPVKGGR